MVQSSVLFALAATVVLSFATPATASGFITCFKGSNCDGESQKVYANAPLHDCNSFKAFGSGLAICDSFQPPYCEHCAYVVGDGKCHASTVLPCYRDDY